MQIVCPECKFAREVDENKIPARSQVATCPKCQTKFKFRDVPEEDFAIEEPVAPEPAAPKPSPEPVEEAPLLRPFTQKAPQVVEQPEEQLADSAEEQVEILDEQTFHGIPQPDADAEGGLWDRLHTMTPPEEALEAEAEAEPQIKREPPVIGAKYGQPAEDPQDHQPVEGWTGEFNSDFPDPMDYAGTEGPEDSVPGEASMQVPPPFEQLDRYGFFSGLFMTIKLILFSPRLFFAVMPVGGGVAKPLTFAILVALVQTLAQFAWGMAGISIGVEPSAQGFVPVPFSLTSSIFELLLTPAFAAISLYIFTGLYHLILSLLRAGDKGFEGTFRILAYAYAPIVTGIIPMPTTEVLIGWMFINGVWGLALTAIGFKHVHKTSYLKAIPALLLPLLIGMIFALLAIQGQLPTV